MKSPKWLPAILLSVALVLTAVPSTKSSAEGLPLVFSDDFSTEKGWIDASTGHIYRDATNEWVNWSSTRAEIRRYYIPINVSPENVQLDFWFKVTQANGNAGIAFGLIENLHAPKTGHYFLGTGIVASFGRDTMYGPRVNMGAKYADLTFFGMTTPESIHYGSINTWRKVRLAVDGTQVTLIVWDENGNELGRRDRTLPQTHSGYNYLMLFLDGTGGWENASGLLDNVALWGKPLNQPPVAVADFVSMVDYAPVTVDAVANDTDVDGNLDPSTATVVSDPAHGTVDNHGNGTFTYTPGPEYCAGDSFDYEVCDTEGQCGTATVRIESLIFWDDFSTHKGWIDESDGWVYRDESNEWLVWNQYRQHLTLYYMPLKFDPGYVRLRYRYKIVDHGGNAGIPFFLIEDLTGAHNHPAWPFGLQSIQDRYNFYRNKVSASYPDRSPYDMSDTKAVNVQGMNAWKSVEVLLDHGNYTLKVWDENGNLFGEQSDELPAEHNIYNYIALFSPNVGGWEWSWGLLDDITVHACLIPNQPPAAVDDAASTPEDTPVIIDVATNDSDPDGNLDPATVNTACDSCSEPSNGGLINHGGGILTYTPHPDWHGTDGFIYGICDTEGLCDTATVTVEVTPLNDPPVLTAAQSAITANEGQAVTNSGTVSDVDDDPVLLGASVGTVINNGDGTWSWNFATTDGPTDSQPVTILADDGNEGTAEVSFELTVENVAPTVTAISDVTMDEGAELSGHLADFTDPGTDDTHVATIEWGDGSPLEDGVVIESGGSGGVSDSHNYANDGVYTVQVCVTDTDDEDAEGCDTFAVTVENVPPEVTASPTGQTVQYSDYIEEVMIEATDVAADMDLSASTEWRIDSGAWQGALPLGLSLTGGGCATAAGDGREQCTWALSGTMEELAGVYTVRVYVEDDDAQVHVDVTITVDPEDAALAFDGENPVAVEVATAGGDSGPFTLAVEMIERTPDLPESKAAPGSIGNAVVSMTLVPVGPGDPVDGTCTPGLVSGIGYDAALPVACEFHDVPVNTYTAVATVSGGYYAGGPVEDVLVVYDPSLGFTTGGGWFYWPGTGEKTNFGYTMKYNKKWTKVQGSLLLIRHMSDGSIYRVKSNSLYGLALGGPPDPAYGWASFSGKCTYKDKDWVEPEGNHEFLVYVEDRDGYRAGPDRFWIEVHGKEGELIDALSLPREAVGNAVPLGGGNTVVPH